jgi:hypothetical protein
MEQVTLSTKLYCRSSLVRCLACGALLSVKQRAAFARKKDFAQAGLSPVVVSVVRNPSDLLLYVSWMVSAAVSFTLSSDYFMHERLPTTKGFDGNDHLALWLALLDALVAGKLCRL